MSNQALCDKVIRDGRGLGGNKIRGGGGGEGKPPVSDPLSPGGSPMQVLSRPNSA